jgi:hypothetical protein
MVDSTLKVDSRAGATKVCTLASAMGLQGGRLLQLTVTASLGNIPNTNLNESDSWVESRPNATLTFTLSEQTRASIVLSDLPPAAERCYARSTTPRVLNCWEIMKHAKESSPRTFTKHQKPNQINKQCVHARALSRGVACLC